MGEARQIQTPLTDSYRRYSRTCSAGGRMPHVAVRMVASSAITIFMHLDRLLRRKLPDPSSPEKARRSTLDSRGWYHLPARTKGRTRLPVAHPGPALSKLLDRVTQATPGKSQSRSIYTHHCRERRGLHVAVRFATSRESRMDLGCSCWGVLQYVAPVNRCADVVIVPVDFDRQMRPVIQRD